MSKSAKQCRIVDQNIDMPPSVVHHVNHLPDRFRLSYISSHCDRLTASCIDVFSHWARVHYVAHHYGSASLRQCLGENSSDSLRSAGNDSNATR